MNVPIDDDAPAERDSGYGWISIVLHWVTAFAIGYLWFIGDTIAVADSPGERSQRVGLHVSVALSFYLLFLFRLAWRAAKGFPRWKGQKRYDRILSKLAQNSMLLCLAAMLATGPVLMLAGSGVTIFERIPLPVGVVQDPALIAAAALVHARAATLLLVLASLHICGAFKHLMFDDDDIFLRMLVPLDERPAADIVKPADQRMEEPGR